ncbi:MFS transporter [Kibdelosporangium lantanae]
MISARLDHLPITPTTRRAAVVVGVGLFFEFYELFLASVLSTVLVQRFDLDKADLAPLLASTFVGMFLGALVVGRLADRFGRRPAFLFNLALYSVFSLLGAFSPDASWLLVTRFVAGVGLGAELPLADTYLTELLPARHRGQVIAVAYTVGFLGVPAVGFLARALAGTDVVGVPGWRVLLVIGAVGAAVVFVLRRGLVESPRWLASVGRRDEAERIVAGMEAEAGGGVATAAEPDQSPRAPVGVLFGQEYRRRTVMMLVFQVFQTIGYYGFGTMVPLVLAAKGFAVSQSLLFTAMTFLGYPVGSAISLPLVERFERKTLVIASALGMAVFGLAFGYADSMVLVVVFGFLYTATSNVFSNGFHIYQAEIFPTSVRSTATGGTYSVSRLATAAMPFVLVPLLDHQGAATLFAVVAGAMVVVAVDVALLGPRTTGRSLDAVNRR